MTVDTHWIGSIAFELRSRDADAIDAVRTALRNDLDVIVNELQRVLDGIDGPGRFVRYRRVEVDLGRLRPKEFDLAAIARRVAKYLEPQLHRTTQNERDLATSAADDFAAFLKTGVLPWPAPGAALQAICTQLLGFDERSKSYLVAVLRPLLGRSSTAAERLVRQCPAALVKRIASGLGRWPHELQIDTTTIFISESEVGRWVRLIARLAEGKAVVSMFDRSALTRPHDASKLASEGGSLASKHTQDRAFEPKVATKQSDAAADLSMDPQFGRPAETQPLSEVIPVDAAGGVLLHPFIPKLFEAAGLVGSDGRFTGAEGQKRGVLLLQFLFTGLTQAFEPGLPLAKLLCGMEPGSLVPRSFEPTLAERAEVDALLSAAIDHWAALGNTSVGALRETFLARPGRLERVNQDWRLSVERRGADALLDRLPWPIGIVKTPFMARPLRVEWR